MTNDELALVPARQGEVMVAQPRVFNLDKFPESKFNRLIPTQTIQVPSDLFVPVIQVVQLDVERDTYTSPDLPSGCRAPNRVGLRKLATAASVSIVDERRTDDGKDPDQCEVTCHAEMILPTGRPIRAPGMKRQNLGNMKWASPAQRARYLANFQEHVASRAENRAIRALLSLQQNYPVADLQKPFAVVSFAPNMANPDVRKAMLGAVLPAIESTFGPEARQLAAGSAPIEVEQAPDDEEEGETREDPSWFGDSPAETKPAAPAETPAARFARVLREKAAASQATGPATGAQRQRLQELLKPLGRQAVEVVLKAVWGLEEMKAITEAQAGAVIALSVDDTFAELWQELADEIWKAAA